MIKQEELRKEANRRRSLHRLHNATHRARKEARKRICQFVCQETVGIRMLEGLLPATFQKHILKGLSRDAEEQKLYDE